MAAKVLKIACFIAFNQCRISIFVPLKHTDLKKIDTELIKNITSVFDTIEKKIAVITHQNPDGDAVGSAAGLANILVNRGHKTVVVYPDDFPAYYNWIECKAETYVHRSGKKQARTAVLESDVLFCLDFNDPSRAGALEKVIQNFEGIKILIDHHPDPQGFCDFTFSDIFSSSTAELVADVVVALGFQQYIDKAAAECLYTGIMTDTGSFKYNISNPDTFKVVSKLLEYRIDADRIHAQVYDNFSAGRMRLLGYCLNEKMEILPDFHTGIISITMEELKKFDYTPGDTEGFVNYPLAVGGIVFSALFIEKEDRVRCSFRSTGAFPSNQFSADHYNGGGHLNAAGGETNETLDQSLKRFKQLLPRYLHLLKRTANELKNKV